MQDLFLFGRPDLFFESVQLMILPTSLYFALWLVHFSATHVASVWKLFAFIPGILAVALLMYMVRTAALLKGVYIVDKDAVLEVLEQVSDFQ